MSHPDLDMLLRRTRQAGPPRGAKERLRARVLAAASGAALSAAAAQAAASSNSAGLGSVASSASAAATSAVAGAKLGLFSSVLVSLAAGALVGTLVSLPTAISVSKRGSLPPASAAAPTSARVPRSVEHQEPRIDVLATSTVSAPTERPSAPQRTAELPSSQVRSIQRETEFLTEAQGALKRGEPLAALSWLDRHDAEFPRGELAEEALAARSVAVCAVSRDTRERVAQRFLERYPGSPLLSRVLAACNKGGEP